MSMHGLYTSAQHLDETLEPLNRIRVSPFRRDKHPCERSHVLYYVSCNISKHTTFKPHTHPSFRIFIPSNGSHLKAAHRMLVILTTNLSASVAFEMFEHPRQSIFPETMTFPETFLRMMLCSRSGKTCIRDRWTRWLSEIWWQKYAESLCW
jgi:hypothetical protein